MEKYNQVQGESALAYEYFKIYRDMPSDQRSLRALCDYQVFGRKRSQSVFTRWSVNHNWQERVRIWDVHRSREAFCWKVDTDYNCLICPHMRVSFCWASTERTLRRFSLNQAAASSSVGVFPSFLKQ